MEQLRKTVSSLLLTSVNLHSNVLHFLDQCQFTLNLGDGGRGGGNFTPLPVGFPLITQKQ